MIDYVIGYFFGLLIAYIVLRYELSKHNKELEKSQTEKNFSIVQKIFAKNFDHPGGLN